MSKENFNTNNPESLIYQNELLKLTVLGGIKLDGLDRMRATLKVEIIDSPRPPIRHNLDLYNDSQVEKFIRKVAERLEIGTSVISASLSELTEQLEAYRLEKIKEKEPDLPTKPTLSAKERKEAEDFLSAPNLLQRTNELIGKSGVIGEKNNRLLMYLIFTSRMRSHPLHVVSLGASGTGKTHLQEKVGELIPEEDKIEITTLSENAFYYFGQRELKNKLILIEDLDGAESSLYPLRELQSKKRISKTIAHKSKTGETKRLHLVVEGPVSVSGCTTKEQIYEDNANRSFLLYLDDSQSQTDLILDYQRALSSGSIDEHQETEATDFLKNVQRTLEPIKVVNPYADQLILPKEVFKPRRTNTHYLQFIEVVTFYNQLQREQKVNKETAEIYIETTLEDIEQANKLLKPILLRKSDNITGAARNHFEKLKLYLIGKDTNNGSNSNSQSGSDFTNAEISRLFRIPITTVKRYHLDLLMNGYLRLVKKKGKKAHFYTVVSYEEFQQLQNSINTALDTALENIKTGGLSGAETQNKRTNKKKQPKSPVQPS